MSAKTINVKAIFRGLDNSLGYSTSAEYKLAIRHEKGGKINIQRLNTGGGNCEYDSLVSFLINWDCIRRN